MKGYEGQIAAFISIAILTFFGILSTFLLRRRYIFLIGQLL